MFELERLKVRGFRGFVGEQEFEFDEPVVILFGENHRGKSSALNAVEWCLFGDECVGKKTGIPERLGWEVANRHAGEGGVVVEVKFNNPDGDYVVRREASGTARRAASTATLTLPDGTSLQGEDAEVRISTLFRSSFRDFMTTVYQHQEAIRAILTDEPRQRNDAIDRLLGLSEFRELLKGTRDAGTEKEQKKIESEFDNLRGLAEQSIRTYENLIREEKEKAVAEGILTEDITEQEALRRAKQVGEALQSLAHDLEIADFQLSVLQNYKEIAEYREWVKDQTDTLWARAPDVAKQEALAGEQQKLATLKGNYETARARKAKAEQERDTFVQQNGDEKALAGRINEEKARVAELEKQIRETNRRASLVREAIEYLRRDPYATGGEKCPLCFSEVPDLLAHLESEWEQKIRKEVAELENERNDRASGRKRLELLRGQLTELEDDLDKALSDVKTCVGRVASSLGREIGKEDDPGALMITRLSDIASELTGIGQAIEEKRPRIRAIYDQLARLRTIDDILNYEGKKAIVEQIWETPEFADVNEIRDEAARLVEDVQVIERCLAEASREEAEDKIRAAGAALDENFRRLTNHPAIPALVMEVTQDRRTGLNSYAFRSTDGTDPIPILSQGDMNCLALSLFLGLARATGDTQPFAFLMLDDPAQSLGSEAKRQLVDVLEDVATWRKMIIATPDDSFTELLETTITKNKTVYEFVGWSEKDGPEIARAT